MKYIHLVPWSPKNNFGGYETIIRTTAKEQVMAGNKAFVVGRTMGSHSRVVTSEMDGVTYIEAEDSFVRRPSTLNISVWGYVLLFSEIFYSTFRLMPIVIDIIRKEKVDAVIFYGIHLFLMSPILRLFGTKTLLGLEVIQKNPKPPKSSYLYWFRKLKYVFFDGIFTYTHYFYLPDGKVINNLSLIRSYTKTSLFYIPWGIDINDLEKSIKKTKKFTYSWKKGKVIICPRRLVEEKGVRYLLRAIPEILKTFPSTYFVFAGDGILRKELEREAKVMKISKNILFTGFLKHEVTLKAMQAADMVVVPSSGEESFGMAFLEAYLLKKPIVTTWFGGIPNVVEDKKTGILVEPKNEHALSKAIVELLKNQKKSEMLAKNGYKRLFSEFQLSQTIHKLDLAVKKLQKNTP